MRSRLVNGCCIALVIATGLLLRSLFPLSPATKFGGDALWALMVFLGVGVLFPRWPTWRVAVVALTFAFGVETSQLYHAPWIDAVRQTRLGALVLGSVFNWPDFVAYAFGVGAGAVMESGLRRWWTRPIEPPPTK